MWSGPGALIQNGSQASIAGLAPGVYTYTWTITNAPCAPSMDDVMVTISDGSSRGVLSDNGPGTVCAGNNTGMLTLAGYSGTVARWGGYDADTLWG